MNATFNKLSIFTFCVYTSRSSSTYAFGKFYLNLYIYIHTYIYIYINRYESGCKVRSGRTRELARLLTTMHKFVCFSVTSPEDIDCVTSSLCLPQRYCGRKCSATHRVLKSHRYFNINTLNTLIHMYSIYINAFMK